MDFYQIITLLFSFLGLMNGLFAAGLFRLKRFLFVWNCRSAYFLAGAVSTTCGMRFLSGIWLGGTLRRVLCLRADGGGYHAYTAALSFDDDRYGAVYPQVCAEFLARR